MKRIKAIGLLILSLFLFTACSPEQDHEYQSINSTRNFFSKPSLQYSEEAGNIAQWYAATLAQPGYPLAHNPYLSQQLTAAGLPWANAGENVGCSTSGGSITQVQDEIFRAYLFSDPHFANIISTQWLYVGTGVARNGNKTCTVHVYWTV